MVFGVLALAHDHGPVAVLGMLATIKYAKYRAFCWRRDSVNQQICDHLNAGLIVDSAHGQATENSSDPNDIDCPAVCACCGCPPWLRRDCGDRLVMLTECGCFVHSTCLLEAAMSQHGLALPHGSLFPDIDDLFSLFLRFFGLAAITVEEINCPRCDRPNKKWRVVESDGQVVQHLVTPLDLPSVINRGDSVTEAGLCDAVRYFGGAAAPEFGQWRTAAESDKGLRGLLRLLGDDAITQLSTIVGPAAAMTRHVGNGGSMYFKEAGKEEMVIPEADVGEAVRKCDAKLTVKLHVGNGEGRFEETEADVGEALRKRCATATVKLNAANGEGRRFEETGEEERMTPEADVSEAARKLYASFL